MNESVLESVKSAIGIEPSDTSFDPDIIMYINTVLSVLKQLGLSKTTLISGKSEKWSEIIGDDPDLESVKTYIALKVRKIFDPPSGSSAASALNDLINELEFRLNIALEEKDNSISW